MGSLELEKRAVEAFGALIGILATELLVLAALEGPNWAGLASAV